MSRLTPSISHAAALLTTGWLEGYEQRFSPNFDQRPTTDISLIVIHSISLPVGEFDQHFICDLLMGKLDINAHLSFADLKDVRVSTHFLIRRNGAAIQFVDTNQRAWHAGLSSFEGRENCNHFSIGIELEGCDTMPFESAQYAALVHLCKVLCTAYPIQAITSHTHIAPVRKTDPGPFFDWELMQRWVSENELNLKIVP